MEGDKISEVADSFTVDFYAVLVSILALMGVLMAFDVVTPAGIAKWLRGVIEQIYGCL
ncbi:MAG: hypothetical protein PHZ19_01515 [Candidatus Thermoplasmatota archaeon]|nr:hypothetical protein [Candidatus Thermoplasmatota archaeon]